MPADPAPDRLRAAEAAPRPVAGVEELQAVGAVPEVVVARLGLTIAARSVWLHPDAIAYIAAQRARAPADAEFVLTRQLRAHTFVEVGVST